MDKYRVIVLREGTSEDTTLFEIAGSATLVARLAPGTLVDAIDADAQERDLTSGRSLADRVFDQGVAAGGAAEAQGETPEQAEAKTKRNRRTKQQIADDKAAQGLGFRDHAHRVEVEAQRQASRDADGAPETYAPQVAPPGEAVVTETPSPATPVDVPAGNPVPSEAPWNPFVQPTH